MRRVFYILLGLALIAICAAWFLGPLQELLMGASPDTTAQGTEESTTRSLRRPLKRIGGIDINTMLNAANAFIGLAGLFIALRAGRARS